STATTPPANSFVTWSSSIAAMQTSPVLVAGLHRAHDVDPSLECHIARVDREHGAGDRTRFVAREIDDEWRDLLRCGDREDVQAPDRCARIRIVQPDHLGLGRDEARRDGVYPHAVRSNAGCERTHH